MQHRAISKVIGVLVGAIGLTLLPAAQAQFSANSQTNLISGVTNNWTGNYLVGNANSADVLLVQSNGVLTDATGYLGFGSNSSSNRVLVTDSGSIWSNGTLYVGNSGSANSLLISNGGWVVYNIGYIGFDTSASNNSVTVTGSGSVWSNTDTLDIGHNGSNNRLTIANGAVAYDRGPTYIGYGSFSVASSSNVVTVSGAGSVWTNLGMLIVGQFGNNNQLILTNGGAEYDTGSTIGNFGSTNNVVTVSGTGSVWSTSLLTLGYDGPSNQVAIVNGGKLNSSSCYLGDLSSGNRVTVSGPGSVWSNLTSLILGESTGGNQLTINNGGLVNTGSGTIGYISSSNSAVVSGSGAVWWSASDLYVGGSFGSANSLVISNGGQVFDSRGFLGNTAGASSNRVLVSDAGSVWSNRNALYVGYQGTSNSLIVAGGSVFATNLVVGFASSTCANLVQLDSGSVIVTNATADAVLEVRNGAFIQNGGVVQANILVVTNACARFIRNGGTLLYSQLVLDPNLSAVGDGIPNGWKQQYGLDPFDPNLANEDPDGDGMNNLQEYLAGTDPTNSASSFRITSVVGTGSDVLVSWMTGIGKTNALQATGGSGYATNDFTDLFSVTNTVGSTTNFLDVGGATNKPARYYRVRLVP